MGGVMLRDDVQLISVDDHVGEPAHVFTAHIEPKFRDGARGRYRFPHQ